MFLISYTEVRIAISVIWILARVVVALKNKHISWKREAQLLLVYICIIVVARFTFFPFAKVDGRVQPLVLDIGKMFLVRINTEPFVHLMDYPELRSAMLNLIGNITMFIPLGIVWPSVYQELNSHKKVIGAGVGVSVCIEILQLPFYDRVTDIDDLILNSLGFCIGYGIYLLFQKTKNSMKNRRT